MDLIGVPHRIVLSDRGLAAEHFEYKGRRDQDAQELPLADLTALLASLGSNSCNSSH